MPKFQAFYDKVVAMKRKYPGFELATYSDANLRALKAHVDFCDNVKNYLDEVDRETLRVAVKARRVPADQHVPEQSQQIIDAIMTKLFFDSLKEAQEELSDVILPGLKEAILEGEGIENEAAMLRRIADIEGQWKKQKKYARFSAHELDAIMQRFLALNEYRGVIARDLEDEEENPALDAIREDLKALSEESDLLLGYAVNELIDAMLARLVLVPGEDRVAIAYPTRDFPIAADRLYDENVLAAVLSALTEVGLDKDYVDGFKKLTVQQSNLLPVFVARFKEYAEKFGDERQKRFVDKLFESPVFRQREFATPFTGNAEKVIPLSIGDESQAKHRLLDRRLGTLEDNIEERFSVADAKKIVRLYDELKVAEFTSDVIQPQNPSYFSYSEPRVVAEEISTSFSEEDFSDFSAEAELVEEDKPEFTLNTRSMISAVRETMGRISQYANGEFEESHRHTRAGRAEHIVGFLNEILVKMLEAENPKEDYCNAIASLFVHYQSISDPKSELSKRLEQALITLLDVARLDKNEVDTYRGALALRKEQSESSVVDKAYQLSQKLFSSEPKKTAKEEDPVFLFLKHLITSRFQSVSEILFEKNGAYNAEAGEILTKLKEKDYQETRYFKHEKTAKTDFDALAADEKQAFPPSTPKH